MEYTVFITQSVFPLYGGKTLASNGYCKAFAKHTNLKVFSLYSSSEFSKEKAEEECGLDNVTFYDYSDKKMGIKYIPELISQIKGKITSTVPIYSDFYKEIVSFLYNNQIKKIIIDHIGMCQYYFKLKKKFPNISFIYNSHNAEFINAKEEMDSKALLSRIFAFAKSKFRYNYEKRMVTESEFVFCISKSDLEIIQREFSIPIEKMIFSKPFIKFEKVKEKQDLKRSSKKIMIIGSMNWYPNVEGVIWFVENVFIPLINQDCKYKLYIVGNKPLEDIKLLEKKYPDNIIVTGFVESTDEYYKMCDISLIPVFRGTGAKIKVLESICRGIPTICSEFAAKDYDVSNEVMVASSPRDFFNMIKLVESSEEIRMQLYDRMMKYKNGYYVLARAVCEALK